MDGTQAVFVNEIINRIKQIITDGIQALGLHCWRWQETSVLPHLELFAEPGKVFSCHSAWCLRPGTNLIVQCTMQLIKIHPMATWQIIPCILKTDQFQYFRAEVDVSDLEQELIETIQFGQQRLSSFIPASYVFTFIALPLPKKELINFVEMNLYKVLLLFFTNYSNVQETLADLSVAFSSLFFLHASL